MIKKGEKMPAKEIDPEGGEGEAAEGGEKGHRTREVNVPMEHCCLEGKIWKYMGKYWNLGKQKI